MMIDITKIIEFDAGHRVTNHDSKCRNVHGHRYRLEATFSGDVLGDYLPAKEGMILDFGDLKSILKEITDPLDHAFLVWENDSEMKGFLVIDQQKHVVMADVPTAENIGAYLFLKLNELTRHTYNESLRLKKLKLFETPNSFAEIYGFEA